MMRDFRLSISFLFTVLACGDNIVPGGPGDDDQPDGGNFACVANQALCDGDDLVTCDAAGNEGSRVNCQLGCDGEASKCFELVPSNLAQATCSTPGSADLVIGDGEVRTFDTAIDCDDILNQPGAGNPMICVKKFATVTIAATGTLTASGPNILAIVATTAMTIDGTVDVSSTTTGPGPGGEMADCSGGQPAQASAGGGGAGFLTVGGSGAVSSQITGGTGGAAGVIGGTPELTPGRGGAAGGQGGPQAQAVAAGGFGGGAIQLASCATVTISMTAVLDAGGGGGGGGNGSLQATIDPGGGGGGGSGGSILIEGASVTVAGGVFANGGGGGSGGAHGLAGTPGVDGNPGEDGPRATTAAPGGAGVIVGTIVTGAGGAGGALALAPTNGGVPTASTIESSGGGGGAAGRIRINVRANTTPTLTDAAISPEHTVGAVAVR
jgi:hypothetical protein